MVLDEVLRLNTPLTALHRRREISGGHGAGAAAAVRPPRQGRAGARYGRVQAGEVFGGGVQGVQGRAGVLPVWLGAGPRTCVAQNLALLEAKMGLAP
ncbi:Cytochrome P450 CYPIV [Panicum miliaceum]|uniref:Cytochrome P450 CYPIV n=1 Tax=Panicum miliaceum TaxID=4540 RepID=A0A3L6P958_PANMI|nr:Cytochrome P450 CYPIV [Panicum miliaceum]